MFTQDGKLQLREYKNLIRDYTGDMEFVDVITDGVYKVLVEENAFGFRGAQPWPTNRIFERSREIRLEIENESS